MKNYMKGLSGLTFILALFLVLSPALTEAGTLKKSYLDESGDTGWTNACALRNPCAGASNPCGMNPCAAMDNTYIRSDRITDMDVVIDEGNQLWKDTSLSPAGMSCSVCHPKGMRLFSSPYPKYIEMAGDIVTLDQMINFCMENPMKSSALPWNGREMTALAAYVMANSKAPASSNPCGVNPCGVNPCAANPCGANPCAANPCAANPCAANPCGVNPCAANPCGVNPCAANPCAANPCGTNPCATNPCAANPCGK